MDHSKTKWYVTKDGMYITNYKPGKLFLTHEDRCIACSPSPHTWRRDETRLLSLAPRMYEALKAFSESVSEEDELDHMANGHDEKDCALCIARHLIEEVEKG